tara:strand:+ start:2825 stop:3319 length:495 start_codon:yes stop_codon:yes gene_type:complete
MAGLGWIEFDEKKWKDIRLSLNRYSQYWYWDEIIQEAVWEWASEIEATAQQYLNQKVKNQTNRLKNSIYVVVDEDGDLAIKSRHRAAKLINNGGPSPFPDWNSKTIKEYAAIYDIEPFLLARGIFQNQPFAEGSFFAQKAIWLHVDDIKDEIYSIARRRHSEGY